MMHKKRWAALVLAAALALTGCSFGGVGGGGSTAQKIDRPAVESAELQFTHPAAGDTVAVFDTSAALLAMLIIIPAMATVGADLGNGGPGLMFIYLLPVFNGLGAGISRVICIFFYLVVLFAGVSSIINLFEKGAQELGDTEGAWLDDVLEGNSWADLKKIYEEAKKNGTVTL